MDWREDATVLKVAFPVEINADFATFDIQCGSVRRPTHRNTSWDTARYEVCAHRWADLSEGDYGVSLLNDCKYGYDAQGHTLRLTLLKAGMLKVLNQFKELSDKGYFGKDWIGTNSTNMANDFGDRKIAMAMANSSYIKQIADDTGTKDEFGLFLIPLGDNTYYPTNPAGPTMRRSCG